MTSEVKSSDAGHVRTLAISNPGRKNALGPPLIGALLRALDAAFAAPEVRVVVITGDGDAFSVGGDFRQMSQGPDEGLPGDFSELMRVMTSAPKPLVARVNGHAMGGGLGIVAACHFAIASRAAKLGTPEIDVGLFPMMIMAVLQRLVGKRRLLEMMLLGQKFDADYAADIGLVNLAVDAGELDAAVEKITSQLASKSPIALRLGLEAFAAQDDLDLEEALPLLRDQLGLCLGTDDAREGLTAFLEKRKPLWTGK